MFREVFFVGTTGSINRAQAPTEIMRERFPNGKYTRQLEGVLQYAEKKRQVVEQSLAAA